MLKNSPYLKIITISMSLFLIVACISVSLLRGLSIHHNRELYLEQYKHESDIFYGILWERIQDYPNTFNPIYASSENMKVVATALEDYFLSPINLQDLQHVLSLVSQTDNNIVAILLEIPSTNYLYAFTSTDGQLRILSKTGTLPNSTDIYRRTILSPSEINSYCASLDFSDGYGITSVLFKSPVSILYSSSVFRLIQSASYCSEDVYFRVLNERGEVLYSPDRSLDTYELYSSENMFIGFSVQCLISQSAFSQNAYVLIRPYAQFLFVIMLLVLASYILFYRLLYRRIHKLESDLKDSFHSGSIRGLSDNASQREFSGIVEQFNLMSIALKHNADLANTYAIKEKNANLYALQTSINPHFLCNALELIHACLLTDKIFEGSEMTVLLSRIYRDQIKGNLFVPLQDELNRCNILLEMYMLQYEDFRFEIRIAPEFISFALPKNTLQPLVENYFEHGININSRDNLLCISTEWVNNAHEVFRVCVENNGFPMNTMDLNALQDSLNQLPDRQAIALSRSFGLKNVNDRLKIVFGAKSGLQLSNPDTGGFRVEFTIPALTTETLQRSYEAISSM